MRRAAIRILERMGLTRPELRAWAFYDWANSGYVTTVIATLFPIYFARVAAADLSSEVATARFATASAVALGTVAVLSPLLGALSDRAGVLKRLLGTFLGLGVVSTAALAGVGRGEWLEALVLFCLGNVGVTGSIVFYDALLRHIARDEELDAVSTAGYALGYLGGGVLLAAQLVCMLRPGWFGLADASEATRAAFLATAAWWLVFSLPLFLRIPEPRPVDAAEGRSRGVPRVSVRGTLLQLRDTFRELRHHTEALKLLVAYLLYSDGIGTIIRMATLYGTEVGIGQGELIGALLLTQAVGIPCAVLFGRVAGRVGTKPALLFTLVVYCGVTALAYFMRSAAHFFALALLVGMVQGGSQALSRSLFAQMVPRHKSAQFFGLFSVFEKVTAILGPMLMAATIHVTGSSRGAVLSLLAFFISGALVLARVDEASGRRAARAAEERVGLEPGGEA